MKKVSTSFGGSFGDFSILGTTKSPEFCDLRERVGL